MRVPVEARDTRDLTWAGSSGYSASDVLIADELGFLPFTAPAANCSSI